MTPDPEGVRAMRGLVYGLPAAAALWVLICLIGAIL